MLKPSNQPVHETASYLRQLPFALGRLLMQRTRRDAPLRQLQRYLGAYLYCELCPYLFFDLRTEEMK